MSHIDQTLGLRNQRPARRVDGALVRLQPYLYGVIEYSILALYLALLYKQVAVVALLLLILSGCSVLVRRARSYVVTPIAVVAILYVFLAMGTAFLVGFNQGVYRTAQFVLVLFASIAATKFFDWADQERKEKFLRNFTNSYTAGFRASGYLSSWNWKDHDLEVSVRYKDSYFNRSCSVVSQRGQVAEEAGLPRLGPVPEPFRRAGAAERRA